MPEEKDVDKNVYSTKKPGKDIYEGIESHRESEMGEEREGGPTAPMRDLRGPVVLSSSTYTSEDESFDSAERKSPEDKKKGSEDSKLGK
ncbi:hypothetical protein [Methanocella paludicola]|nr:hypothetical protein [Methanocella paludicola]